MKYWPFPLKNVTNRSLSSFLSLPLSLLFSQTLSPPTLAAPPRTPSAGGRYRVLPSPW